MSTVLRCISFIFVKNTFNLLQICCFTLQAGHHLLKGFADGRIDAECVLMVCDKPGAKVIERAEQWGVESFVFSPRDYRSKADFEAEIVRRLDYAQVELVCLAGYMRIVGEVLLGSYEGRIINLHPALLPSFKGAHAIEQAFEAGVKVFGVTIHYVDSSLDGGAIIDQRAFYSDGESHERVEERIHQTEHALYPEVIAKLLNSKQ